MSWKNEKMVGGYLPGFQVVDSLSLLQIAEGIKW